ncbi:MAG: tetratricopeptide repeat protein [Phycisphaerae bacterium]
MKAKEYETPVSGDHRNSDLASELCAKAAKLIKQDQLPAAERELKMALTADAFFGPAHNNLGMVYYQQQKYYLAAWEFQYAAKLMPTKAEPKNNLGMVFEAVGRRDEAARNFEEALALDDDCVDAITNLASIYVRQNRKDEKTRALLNDIVLKDTRPEWTDWARQQLALMGPARSATTKAAE